MGKVSGTRLRPGDVLEIRHDGRIGLITYLGRHWHFGDIVWVLPRLFSERPADVCAALADSGYFQFYPATTTARHRLVEKIGFCTTGMRLIPKQWRNMVVENADGTARTWNICDEKSRLVRHTLSAAERELPIGEIINHALLCERLEEQWTPARYEKAP